MVGLMRPPVHLMRPPGDASCDQVMRPPGDASCDDLWNLCSIVQRSIGFSLIKVRMILRLWASIYTKTA